MSTHNTPLRRGRRAPQGMAALGTCLLVVACGSGSTSSTSSAAKPTAASGSGSGNRTAFVQCLKQYGVTPPSGGAGKGTHSGPPPAGGGGGLGASPTRLAAFKACGATGRRAPAGGSGA